MIMRITSPGRSDLITYDRALALRELVKRQPDVKIYFGKPPLEVLMHTEEILRETRRRPGGRSKMAPLLFETFSYAAELEVIDRAIETEIYLVWRDEMPVRRRVLAAMSERAARDECWRRLSVLYPENERDLGQHFHLSASLPNLVALLNKACWDWLLSIARQSRRVDCLITEVIISPDQIDRLAEAVSDHMGQQHEHASSTVRTGAHGLVPGQDPDSGAAG